MKKHFSFYLLIWLLGGFISMAQESFPPVPPPQCEANVTIWDGTTWSNGAPNTTAYLSFQVFFDEDFNSTENLFACTVTLGTNVLVNFNSYHTLTVENGIDSVNGNLTFQNNASLVQINPNAVNAGNINYIRDTTPVNFSDYTYWSSPVSGQLMSGIYAAGQAPNSAYGHYYWNASATPTAIDSAIYHSGAWAQVWASATIMTPGVGYIVPGPASFSASNPDNATITFSGPVNNGTISVPVQGESYTINNSSVTPCAKDKIVMNFVGNPYPSAIDADTFLDYNQSIVNGSVYMWAHNTLPSGATVTPQNGYPYTRNDFVVYNRLGGVGTGRLSLAAPSISQNTNRPFGKIASGQGFFVQCLSDGNAVFTNDMRDGATGANSQFFRTSQTQSLVAPLTRDRIWVGLRQTSSTAAVPPYKETLVGYIQGATNGYEKRFDTESFSTNPIIDLYSVMSTSSSCTRLTIQGRQYNTTFNVNDVIPLGYTVTVPPSTTQTFTITADGDGIFGGGVGSQKYYLEDLGLNIIHDFTDGPYIFTANLTVVNNSSRFRIIFKIPYTTNLNNANCGYVQARDEAFNRLIYRQSTTTSVLHRWRFKNMTTTQIGYIETTSTSVKLSDVVNFDNTGVFPPFFAIHNTVYEIDIATLVNGHWLYGRVCTIKTAEMTITNSTGVNICGTIFPILNQSKQIRCSSGAPYSYNWVLTRADNVDMPFTTGITANFLFQTAGSTFFPQGFLLANTQYEIKVQIIYPGGVLGEFSLPCIINTGNFAPKMNDYQEELKISLYPNPFEDKFLIGFETSIHKNLNVKIFDMTGKLLQNEMISINELSNASFGESFATGVYTVVLNIGDEQKVFKMIKR